MSSKTRIWPRRPARIAYLHIFAFGDFVTRVGYQFQALRKKTRIMMDIKSEHQSFRRSMWVGCRMPMEQYLKKSYKYNF
jgi:hypothetical protein